MGLIRKTPTAICGVSLALAALGNVLLPYGAALRYACGILSGCFLLLFLLKCLLDSKTFLNDTKNPVVLGTLPTATMAIMLLSTYIKPFIGGAATAIWWIGVCLHILIMCLFAFRFVFSFSLNQVFPTWFVAAAGLAVISVTCKAMDAVWLGQLSFYIGIALYAISLPVVIMRMVKVPLPPPAQPTVAIFAAPVSLCLVGYSSAFEAPNPVIGWILFTIVAASYLFALIKMLPLLARPFAPTIAAYGFPFAISALAFRVANNMLFKGAAFFTIIAKGTEVIAALVVCYMVVRYILFLIQKPAPAK